MPKSTERATRISNMRRTTKITKKIDNLENSDKFREVCIGQASFRTDYRRCSDNIRRSVHFCLLWNV